MASEKSTKKKFFRKAIIHRDNHWVNPTTVTVTNTTYGLLGSVNMLHGMYKSKVNFGTLGLGVFQTTVPQKSTSRGRNRGDKEFEGVAVLDLESFVGNFVQNDAMADFIESKCAEIQSEWKMDNQAKDKAGSRIPIERVFCLAKYAWEGRARKREESEYDLQLSK
jgi:hypothetical protein